MFDQSSRYAEIETASLKTEEGRIISYKKRRFLPASENMRILTEITTNAADRLDLLTYRTIGDPEQYWRICDANNIMHPLELTDVPDTIIRIPLPGG